MFSQLDQQNSFLEMYIKMGLTHLLFGLTRGKDPSGTICHGCPESVAYCKAMMAAYTYGRRDEAEFFAQMFKGFRELAQTAAAIMKAFTGIEVSAND
jgi:hypothetical protein